MASSKIDIEVKTVMFGTRASFVRRFLLALTLVAAGVVLAGWFTGFRDVAHGALLSCAAFAFLPFVLIAAGLALLVIGGVVSLIAAFVGDVPVVSGGSGEAVVEMGLRSIFPYYNFLSQQRHPIFWGIPIGALLGGLGLWIFVATIIVPGEVRTVEILLDAQARIESTFVDSSRYPAPTEAGHLQLRSIGEEGAPAEAVLTDGFGRPVVYRKWGHWKLATYSLHSNGYDGTLSKDDLCRAGGTGLGRFAQALEFGRGRNGKGVSVSVRLGSVLESRCSEGGGER